MRKPGRHWTRQEVRRLRSRWDVDTLARLAVGFRRTKLAVYMKAGKLGLPLGAPEGWEFIGPAARRCGFTHDGMYGVLAWAGVPIRHAMSRHRCARAAYRWNIVETDAVNEAVAAWTQTETVGEAAARHGVDANTVRRRLLALGERRPIARRRWRVDRAVVDHVMAAIPFQQGVAIRRVDQPTKGP